MEWITIKSADALNEELLEEKERWEAVADDVALIPDRVVRLVEEDEKVQVQVHEDLYGYFRQGLY